MKVMNMNSEMFLFIQNVLRWVGRFFLAYMLFYSVFLLLSVVIGTARLYFRKRQYFFHNQIGNSNIVPVSVIVPAHNEEMMIADTVRSLLASDYRNFEIVVVDDGSTDKTTEVLLKEFPFKPSEREIERKVKSRPAEAVYECHDCKVPIILVKKQNGGKADALNMGLNVISNPYFICMDADSQLQHDALTNIVYPILEKENVIAVGGMVRPSNDLVIKNARIEQYRFPRSILACMQVLEYERTFLSTRLMFDTFNGSLIISGAFGLFRKDYVVALGGYSPETLGEDMELVVKLHEFCLSNNIDYRICYASDAICWTQVPEKLPDLFQQRKRWHIGLFESMVMHNGLLLKGKYGMVSLISYMYFLIYELLSPLIELIGIAVILLSAAVGLLNYRFMIMFFLLYALYTVIITLTAFFARIQTTDLKIGFPDILKVMVLCIFEVTVLRFVLAVVRFTALFGYKTGKKTWGSISRYKQNE